MAMLLKRMLPSSFRQAPCGTGSVSVLMQLQANFYRQSSRNQHDDHSKHPASPKPGDKPGDSSGPKKPSATVSPHPVSKPTPPGASQQQGTLYEMQFRNLTDDAYYFGIYQTFPLSPGLKSVAWKVVGLPPGGIGRTQWEMDYGVAIANWQTGPPGIYSEQQIVPAQLGNSYNITYAEGTTIPTINPKPTHSFGNSGKDIIKLANTIPPEMTVGFTVNGDLIAVQEGIGGGKISQFVVHPTYFVAAYNFIKKGMLVDSGVQLMPIEVQFDSGYTNMMVEAKVTDGGIQRLEAYHVS